MKLIFHGGAREVGRSCVELVVKDKRILLDCGLKLTTEDTEYPLGIENPDKINAVFISHAHLDHTGALPLFDHKGMNCPVFATKTTKALTKLLLKDALKIGKIKHQHLGYDTPDIKRAMSCMLRVNVNIEGNFEGIEYKYFDAGHIPGSGLILLKIPEEGSEKKILYTGDINTIETKLHYAANTPFTDIDLMICESTYGDREHPPRERTELNFIKEINDTIARGGSILIPVFALGRFQEIMLLLAEQKFKIPVYFDGMGIEATNIILDDADDLRDAKTLRTVFGKAKKITSASKRTEATKKQSIIVTTSGMLTGGPVLFYLNQFYSNPKNAVLLTGYQGENTNGRLLLETGAVFIDGFKKQVKCTVKQFDFSAHAGMSQLKSLVREIKPKKIFFMHGEEQAINNLTEWATALGMDAYGPKNNDEIRVE
jgi:putative mRNA 3-end processing factor